LSLLLAFVAVGCDSDDPSSTPIPSPTLRRDAAVRTLAALEEAVAARDASAAEKLAGNDSAGDLLRGLVANAEDARVEDLAFRFVDEDVSMGSSVPANQWVGAVDTTWAFAGFDQQPAHTEVTFTFADDGDQVRVTGIGGGGRRTPLWLAADLEVRRTADSLVMVDGSAPDLDRYARLAARALPVVRRVLPGWRDGLVVEVPASAAKLDETLGAEAGEFGGIAAVTTSPDGSLAPSAPVHIFVNPTILGGLKPTGAQVVMSHEATHVATDAVRADMPLWLLEGFADYVALRDVDIPLSVSAGQIIAQVRKDGPPEVLPAAAEFDTQTTHLGAAYEAAWLAVRLLATTKDEATLVSLYRRASRGGSLDVLLRESYGFGEKELLRRWRLELRELAR
jgi:hypothetical protein